MLPQATQVKDDKQYVLSSKDTIAGERRWGEEEESYVLYVNVACFFRPNEVTSPQYGLLLRP